MLFFRRIYTQGELEAFLAGAEPDDKGRYLRDMILADDFWWEKTHDYIQWMFPTNEKSAYNPSAPMLEVPVTIKAPLLEISYLRFREFLDQSGWKRNGDHNQLRITRVLKCLCLFGRKDLAEQFLEFLLAETADRSYLNEARRYWMSAVDS